MKTPDNIVKIIVWVISTIVTGIFVLQIALHMYKVDHTYPVDAGKVATPKMFSTYLIDYYTRYPLPKGEIVYYVPTGIFVESFKFVTSSTVNISGYVWQKYNGFLLKYVVPGIVFPEATHVKISPAYNIKHGDITTIGWYFEGDFTKNFNYTKYPLDQKIIWLRIWPSDFNQDIMLVPDFSSYAPLEKDKKFGINADIVLQGYVLIESFFGYKVVPYDTNFGITGYSPQDNYLEYYFNIVVKRNVLNTLVSYLLPLVVVVAFVFILLMNISISKEQSVLTCCATFLFVILLSHIRLRENLTEGNIVYIEYIYFILYFALIYVVLVFFLSVNVKIHNSRLFKLVAFEHYLPLKVVFLPTLFGLILLVTKIML